MAGIEEFDKKNLEIQLNQNYTIVVCLIILSQTSNSPGVSEIPNPNPSIKPLTHIPSPHPSDSEGDTPNMIEDYPYPNTNALFCGGLSRFFQGEPRSNSPFCLSEEHDMTISKTVIFNTLREGGKKLSLRVNL